MSKSMTKKTTSKSPKRKPAKRLPSKKPARRAAPKIAPKKQGARRQAPKRQAEVVPFPQKKKLVYTFGDGKAEGSSGMKELLGGKGANLAEMCSLGLPVPPGFTITTDVCVNYYKN